MNLAVLSCQRELHGETKVVGGRRITAGRQQRSVGLRVVVGSEGKQAREGVVGHEGEFESRVTTRSGGDARGDVTRDGGLTAQGNVETQVQVVVHTRS